MNADKRLEESARERKQKQKQQLEEENCVRQLVRSAAIDSKYEVTSSNLPKLVITRFNVYMALAIIGDDFLDNFDRI